MFIVGGSIVLMLFIMVFFLVNIVVDNICSCVEKEFKFLVVCEVNDVEGFFVIYGGVVRVFLSSFFL